MGHDGAEFDIPLPSVIFVVKLVKTALPESEYMSSCSADKLKCSMSCLRNRGSAVHMLVALDLSKMAC